ncbi:ATP-binding cassette domain-containing protein [Bacillus sp. HMF5848]|uniref:betaine/proline/choline family ABC transporter ATP-binding protein n=1 Tax=Bacillus sp. HMF5848 TaxID=2495421 RepID=UPI000F78932C|nr:betaine/proline/choline family ABC transporter ATP-binding protein [Bacillus sp. HMF5848]RSK27152.1 ATP-binding cassette domain-containing protein [Bacillus sp. HMF5848]
MIVFENVSKEYDNGLEVLKNINLEVKKGELLTLIGPSGCGKTTTMKMINRLLEPTSGVIRINNEDVANIDPVELRRNIGYVIQQIGLLPHMTIAENIALVPKLKKWSKQSYTKRVDELLDLVGLDPYTYRDRYPLELSGGQQQRIGVVRALAAEPDIVLMDEPFSALDPISREQLQDELVHIQKTIQKTIVFVTHDMDEAIKIANRIAIMKEGEIIQIDSANNMLQQPKNDFVRSFIGESRLTTLPSSASDLLSTTFAALNVNDGVSEAIDSMKAIGMKSLPVVSHAKQYCGIVHLHDVEQHIHTPAVKISELLHTDYQTISQEDTIETTVRVFLNNRQNLLPVLEHDKLIGFITQTSLISRLANLHDDRNVEEKKVGGLNE